MKTVFLFIGIRGYLSDLLHTPYIKYLSEKYKVVVFFPPLMGHAKTDISDYYKNENIEYVILPYSLGKFWTLFNELLRNEFICRFNDNPAVRWRNKRAGNPRRLFLRKIRRLLPKQFFSTGFFTFLEVYFLSDYKYFKQYAKKYNPALVITATPGLFPFDAYAVLCAKKYGIPTLATNFSWDNLTSYPRHLRKTNYLICWNDTIQGYAKSLHNYTDRSLFTSGIMRFDHYFTEDRKTVSREEFLKSKKLDPERKTILFASNTFGTFHKDFLRAFIGWQKEGLLEKLNLLVRLHPHDALEDFKEFVDLPNIHIEYAGTLKQSDSERGEKIELHTEDRFNLKQTFKYSDVCVNLFSTLTLEAFIFDLPVISPGFIEGYNKEFLNFIHYRPLREKKSVKLAHTMDEIKNSLDMYLKNPSLDRKERKEIVTTLVRPTDGFSYKRSVDFLDEIL